MSTSFQPLSTLKPDEPLMVAPFAFFFLRFARRRLDMLGNAESLAAFLTQLNATQGRAGIDQVAISTAIFNEIGAIEDLHIQGRRERAMAEFSHGSQGYAVLKSRAMIADIAKLKEASQLKVETCIAELATEPRLPDVARESDGVWRIPVKETQYEIVCRIDEAARRIELLSLAQDHGMSSTRPT